jgi:hypothetical protein
MVKTMKKRLLIFLCFAFVSFPAYALDYGNIKTLTRSLIRDVTPSSGSPVFSNLLLGQYINIIHREMAVNTWCIEDSHTYAISGWQREFQFTDDMIAINRLTLDGELIEQKSIAKLDDSTTWGINIATAVPSNYYVRHTTVSVIGFDTILSTANVHSFTVWYVKNPDELVNDTDKPFNSQARLEPFHYAIVLGAASMISYAYGKPTDGDRYYNMYIDRVKAMEQVIRLNPDYMPNLGVGKK